VKKASATERAEFKKKVAKIASEAAESADKEAIRRVFSKDQRQQLSAYCKKHGMDQRRVINEIIDAGMKAKGVTKKTEDRA
jgi:hypothetical protein